MKLSHAEPRQRSYRMVARAETSERTRRAILDAAVALFDGRDLERITLDAVASRAGVTLQTVLRKFGSKSRLIDAAIAHGRAQVKNERTPPRPGDHRAAIRKLVASYERLGERNWQMLRHEGTQPGLRRVLRGARKMHDAWVAAAFAHLIDGSAEERRRRRAQLCTVTDFYVWKLHRRDLGRSRAETERLIVSLVEAVATGRAMPTRRGA